MVRDVHVPCWPGVNWKPVTQVPWSKVELHQLFKSVDKNGDGKLSKEELKEAFRKLGSRGSSFRAGRALHHADSNGDGLISEEELDDVVNYAVECGYKL